MGVGRIDLVVIFGGAFALSSACSSALDTRPAPADCPGKGGAFVFPDSNGGGPFVLPVTSSSSHELTLGLADDAVLHGPPANLSPGAAATVSIRPEDVALSRTHVDGISVRNQLRGRVAEITERDGVVWVRVDAGLSMIVRITRAAADAMAMAPGDDVWCLVKVSAIRYLDV